ncbi:gephyrin-like molybdotransferase Glp [Polaromonas sp.]|jgi:molybdopterin molybdotransferase|uniref:molybdopterin molybdotransferase MoeA n=1 Tax=Polaromonas sp. TaxID=1869339 RepID=UPI002B564091|nr:gephyrin-like molybdotransferase Glp [Polaromonas sp.]HQS32968.1 molybdopterin molybdotransferase MoeA [Polaromonas sp.]HQS92243.1 molybdopterin molybdotransferase MoeA [Polaromonas sp.]
MNASPATPVSTPPARAALKPLDAALDELLAYATALPDAESVLTFDADGRVLAQDLTSSLNVPAHDNSSMDGYAVRAADCADAAAVLQVSQRMAAGISANGLLPLAPQSAARIFTGAPIPPGADAVVMQEDCVALEGTTGEGAGPRVQVKVAPQPGQWIRRRGEDVAAGSVVLQRGERLGPASLGLAASIGFDRLQVARRVRVALFSTGDELVMPGEVLPQDMKPGAIYNSNRFFLRTLLQRLGCVVTDLGIVPDRLEATIAALKTASDGHDLILTSGGVSVGEEDHIKPAVRALGELNLWQIAIKPGKPFAYGHIGGAHFIGLPGNPVSSFVTFLVLVRPFILKLQGAREVAMKSIAAPAHFTWARADKRREFLRVRQNAAGGLDLFDNQSSGVLTSAVWGDGLLDNPPGRTIAHGDMVQFVPFSSLLC